MLSPIQKHRLKSSDAASVTFKSSEGRSIHINKYFLFLFNSFYRSILEELIEESPVFIFEGVSYDELILLEKQILLKHLQCFDHSQSMISDEDDKDDEDKKTQLARTDKPHSIDSDLMETSMKPEAAHNNKNEESEEETKNSPIEVDNSEKKYSNDILECPFKCQEVPERDWTVDTLFAHIFSKHISDVRNNFYVSISTFIDKLSSKLSSTNCAFKCEKSKHVYNDLVTLKIHYQRCHEEDPVICAHCGDSFMNKVTLREHISRIRVQQKCNLCGGKTFKNINEHMKNHHGKKTIECSVDGCPLKFNNVYDLKKHTRVVHKKEKPFVCDKCGTKMAQFHNLKDHRIKVHKEGKISIKEYREIILSGKHNYLSKDSELPNYL